jgi:hypothetical protein
MEEGIRTVVFAPADPLEDVVDAVLIMIDGSELIDALKEPALGRRRMQDLVTIRIRRGLGLTSGDCSTSGEVKRPRMK